MSSSLLDARADVGAADERSPAAAESGTPITYGLRSPGQLHVSASASCAASISLRQLLASGGGSAPRSDPAAVELTGEIVEALMNPRQAEPLMGDAGLDQRTRRPG